MLAFLLMSCTREQAPGLVLISPHSDEIQNEFEAAFKRYYRGEGGREISLEWLDVGGGTSSILRYIKSEFGRRPEGIGVDVFFGGGLDPYAELAELELCSPYRLPDALLSPAAGGHRRGFRSTIRIIAGTARRSRGSESFTTGGY